MVKSSTRTAGALQMDAGILEDRVFRKIALRLIPLLMLGFICAQLNRVNIGFAKLGMQETLGFSDAVYGLGAGIFFMGYFIFELPSNLIISKVGARVWLARIMLTWGVISACTLFVTTPTQFYIARFLLGAAEAGFAPGVVWYLATWFPAKQRGRAMALFLSSIPLAGIIGAPLSGWVLSVFEDVGHLHGWQWLLLVEAVPTLILAVVTYLCLEDRAEDAKWLSPEERHLVIDRVSSEDQHKHQSENWSGAFRLPIVWVLSVLSFCGIMGLYAVNFWLPTLVKRAGVTDTTTIGLLVVIPYLVALGANLFSGYSADRTGKRRLHYSVAMIIGATGLISAMALNGGPIVTIVCLSIAAGGTISAVILFWAFPGAFMAGTTAAAGFAILNSVGNLAGFVSPYMVGAVNTSFGRFDIPIYIIAAFMVAGAALAQFLPRKVDR